MVAERAVEERDLLSVAYKNAVDSRRAAWRVITSVEQKEKSKGEERLASYAREYVAKVEGELQKIRDGVFALMDKNLIQLAHTDESKVFYHKMKGDYHRYLAEFATNDAKGKAAESACVDHGEASKIAEKDLVANHPVRVATALNFSVFQSDVFQNSDEASEMARVAFEDAITAPVIDIPAVTQQTPIAQIVQKTIEIPQLHCIDNVIDVPVVEVVQVPQVQVMEKTVEIPQLHVVEKIVEIVQFQTVQRTQTFESLGTAPVCQLTQAEIVEAVEIGAPLPAESGPPIFVTAPVLEVPPVDVEQPVLVAEYVAPARAITYAHAVPVVRGTSDHIDSGADSLPCYGADRHLDSVEDIPVMQQNLLLTAQTVQKAEEIPQVRHIGRVVGVPVVVQR